ncbi:uncharacterized protein PST29_2236 [Pseudomonas sp. St29]|nr:uncharacterized protein PST29_2236 [Pseudomonas sp. St29]
MPSLGEAPSGGAGAFGYFGLFKVTRCKSETISGRDRSNGYVHKKDRKLRFYDRCAAEREQAPSPQ